MRALGVLVVASLVLLAGCAAGPDEAVEPNETGEPNASPDDVVNVSGTDVPPTPTSVAPTPTPTPPPASPTPATPPSPTPPAPTPTPVVVPTPSPTPPPPSPTPPAPTPTPTTPTPPSPPSPTPAQPWPREGSYVTYQARTGQAFANTPMGWEIYANMTWTYSGGDWSGTCVYERHSTDDEGAESTTTGTVAYTASDPPHWPLFNTRNPPAVGEDVTTWYVRGCSIDNDTWPYRGTDSIDFGGASVPTHRATSNPGEPPYDFQTEWSTSTGLVMQWSLHRFMTSAPFSTTGRLVATDAPLT